MDYIQLHDAIKNVLKSVGLDASKNAVDLLAEVACVESNCGEYIKQIKGPARGIFQMEPNTAKDILTNYVSYRPYLKDAVSSVFIEVFDIDENLEYNLPYAIVLSRIFFMRIKEAIPNTTEKRADYWKKYYNTALGKGNAINYLTKVKLYAR